MTLRISSLTVLATVLAQAQVSDTVVRAAGSPARTLATVVQELSIGTVDGPPEYAFANINAIALTSNGSIVVLDDAGAGSASVRTYSPAGRFVRRIGGVGSGPGEYQRPHGMTVTRDGRVAVFDALLRRLTFYSPSGQYLTTTSLPRYITGPEQGTLRTAANGSLILRVDEARPPEEKTTLVILDSIGRVLDTVSAPNLGHVSPLVHRVKKSSRATIHSFFHGTYMPRTKWEWSPLGYFVTCRTDRYAVDLRIPAGRTLWINGDPVLSIRLATAQVPVSARERGEQRALMEKTYSDMPGDPLPDIPRLKPFLRHIYVGDEGRIWVAVSVPSDPNSSPTSVSREPTVLDVFETTGAYRGRVRLPDNFKPLRFIGDQIYGITTDEMGVNFVRKYRVRWP